MTEPRALAALSASGVRPLGWSEYPQSMMANSLGVGEQGRARGRDVSTLADTCTPSPDERIDARLVQPKGRRRSLHAGESSARIPSCCRDQLILACGWGTWACSESSCPPAVHAAAAPGWAPRCAARPALSSAVGGHGCWPQQPQRAAHLQSMSGAILRTLDRHDTGKADDLCAGWPKMMGRSEFCD